MLQARIFNIANVSFNVIHENKILAKISKFTLPKSSPIILMRRSRIFCQRGSNSGNYTFSLVNEGRESPNYTKSGQLLARQRNAIVSLTGRLWPHIACRLGSFVILIEYGPILPRNPIAL